MRILLPFTLGGIVLAAAPASDGLREIVHPAADLPAFQCLVPADWKSEVDATGNLQVTNRARTVFFSFSFAHTPNPGEAHDALARAVLNGPADPPWDSREPVEISGHRGFRYVARVKSGDDLLRAELLIVQVGDRHLAACSVILADRLKPADETTARLVLAAVKLLDAP
jgi:hypothetical protein